jgi:hypothetical protein
MTWEEIGQILALLGFSSTIVGGVIAFLLKGAVENQFKQNIERFKIQFSKLHEMRAHAIAELYASIVDVEQALHDWIYKDMPVGVAPPTVDIFKAIEQVRTLRTLALRSRILLKPKTCEAVDAVVRELESVGLRLENREIMGDDDARWDAHKEALDRLQGVLLRAKGSLEEEFRTILGTV